MAEWNKGKVLPSAINGGQEFTKKDNLAINELNAIVNNSFYASEKSERAESLAESAVQGNGTRVTIGSQIQGEWSADFSESEKNKSENIYEYLGDGAINVGYGFVSKTDHKWYPNQTFARTVFMKCKPNTTYHITKIASGRFSVSSFNVTTENLIPPEFAIANVYVSDGNEGQGVTYLKITTSANDNRLAVFCVDTSLDPNVEEILQSIEVSEFGEIVHKYTPSNAFAESERQKSRNLYTNRVRSETVYGMVWKNENGRITVIGTPYETYTENFEKQPLNIEKAGKYTLSVHNSDQSFAFGLWVYDKNDNLLATFSDASGLTHELEETAVSCRPFIEGLISGNSYTFDFNAQLEYGSVATDYQPYNGAIVHEKDIVKAFWSGMTVTHEWAELTMATTTTVLNDYPFDNANYHNIEGTADGLVIKKKGFYYVDFNVSVERTDTSLSNLYLYVLKNGGRTLIRHNNATGDNVRHLIVCSGIIRCEAGDVINLGLMKDNDVVTGKLINLNFTIKEI